MVSSLLLTHKVSSVIIRLSRPLLQLRPFSDTINTLLHEMIHAYFFVIQGGSLDRDGHGADFCALMKEINEREGSGITVYHSFHEEVNHLRRHVWRCTVSDSERKRLSWFTLGLFLILGFLDDSWFILGLFLVYLG